MRDKIWASLCNMQFKEYYIDFQINMFQKYDRNINIFLAFTSSTSIAAWAMWKDYAFVWALIIAISQIITVIKPYFPYYKYVKELNIKYARIGNINIEFEKLWDSLKREKLTEDEASEIYYKLKKECNDILKFSDETVFSHTKTIEKKANECMSNFLEANYGINPIKQ
jgi:hypothetical protein